MSGCSRLANWVTSKLEQMKTTIIVDGKPYLTRYYLLGRRLTKDGEYSGRPFNIYLHHFHASDGDRSLHDHPWYGFSLIVKGGYVEERAIDTGWRRKDGGIVLSPTQRRIYKPGMWNLIGKKDFHRVELLNEIDGAWSLFFAGPRNRAWGFVDRATGKFTHHSEVPGAIP